ncbi:MAG: ABC transporter permease [Phocaeicola sp.]|uniref:ABC transporter permease n=1 Tax=Phocaeicola sp. TaxID=2773926 RepID=UPI003FA121AD
MKKLKTYFHFLNHNKLFTFVNVLGLSISLMFVLLIANMITRQLRVDAEVKDADHISLFANEYFVGAHYNLGDKLQSRYPEIEDWCVTSPGKTVIAKVGDTNYELNSLIVRKNFYSFFGYRLVEGKAEDVLQGPTNVVLTRKGAVKLFGTEHAVGKTFLFTHDSQSTNYVVSGIAENIDNSIFPDETEAIFPFEIMEYVNWSSSEKAEMMNNAAGAELFIKTPKGVDFNRKKEEVKNYLKTIFWIYSQEAVNDVQFIPMKDFYFSEIKDSNGLNQYDFTQVIIYIIVGIIILLMAVFNYICMSIVQTSYRAKEMATRRLLGSNKKDIFWRMIEESLLLTFIAFLLGFLLAKAAEPLAIDLFRTKIDITGDLNAITLLIYVSTIALLAFVSGFFPATILSNYHPMDIVKGTFRRKTKAIYLRLLSIFQNGLTIALLTCALFMASMFYFLLHLPLGYSYENILTLDPVLNSKDYHTFRSELQKLPFVNNISFSDELLIEGGRNNTQNIKNAKGGPNKSMSFEQINVDSAFIKMFDIHIIEDRKLQPDKHNWFFSENAIKTANELGYTDYITTDYNDKYIIAGIINDIKIRSVLNPGSDYILMNIIPNDSIKHPGGVCVQVHNGDFKNYKEQIDSIYSGLANGIPFSSRWYSDMVKQQYEPVSQLSKTIGIFTFAALVISLLGLTAMSIYFITQRRRDMAIRKVFGSTNRIELFSLMKFTLRSLFFSLIIALPLMWGGIKKLNDLIPVERYDCPWWIPLVAIAFVTVVSLTSVYIISNKATKENPIDSIKTE